MATAERSQRDLVQLLTEWQRQGEVRRFRGFWIINALVVEGTPRVFALLERHPSVAALRPNIVIQLPRPRPRPTTRQPQQAFTWGLRKIRVPEAWRDFGVQGENVVVGVIDTGIDANHPDLRGKLRPQNGWKDFVENRPNPYDDDGHGTHVSGTIAGGNASGTHIGVAPRATLIVAKAFTFFGGTFEWLTAAMQWVMDPDGDPNTDDGADVVNNSWGSPSNSPTMIPEWRDILNAWIAARIFPAFGIGNEGPEPRTTYSPGDYPMAFGVGATDENDRIADFSSRGPVFWEGIGDIIKPDVSAPGVGVLSAVPGGGYDSRNGTSMACPHVAGTVALMISLARLRGVDRQLDVDFFKRALEETAVDLGIPGKDNAYGSGRIDAYEALRRIPSIDFAFPDFPDFSDSRLTVSLSEVEPGGTVTYTLRLVNSGAEDATDVLATVPNIPAAFSDVTVLDGGDFDPDRQEVRWSLPRLSRGQGVTLRFEATVSPTATEQTIALIATISVSGTQLFLTPPAVLHVVPIFDPFEINDTPAQAHRLVDSDFEVVAPDGTARGTRRAYLADNDEDWFLLQLPPNKTYWIEVRAWQTGLRLNAQLQAYDRTATFLLASNRDYIGRDPVLFLKSESDGEFLVRVIADPDGPLTGSYRLILRDITAPAVMDFRQTSLVGNDALQAGKVVVFLGQLRSQGTHRRQVLAFNFPIGLRLITPSQARFVGELPIGVRESRPLSGPTPMEGDWLLFIADANEPALYQPLQRQDDPSRKDPPALPSMPLNLGRLWVQEREGVLFFRSEFLGRLVRSLSEVALTVDLDIDGNLMNGAEFRLRFSPTQRGVFQGNTRKGDFVYLNFTESFVDFGVRLADLGNPTTLQGQATLRDLVIGTEDQAPDLGWAHLTRLDPNQPGIAFSVSPAAGTFFGGSLLTLWSIADARTARAGTVSTDLTLPAATSTLVNDVSQPFQVEVRPGPPARLRLTLSATQVPSSVRSVTVTATVEDASGNGVSGQRVRLTVSPLDLGNFDGTSTIERTTDTEGQAVAILSLTGRVGTLTVRAEVPNTSLFATHSLEVQLGTPAALQVTTIPPIQIEGGQQIVRLRVGEALTLRVALTDAGANPIPGASLFLSLIPPVGQPQVFTLQDGSTAQSPTQLPDEDRTADGTVTITLGPTLLGTQTKQWDVLVSPPSDVSNVSPVTFQIALLAGAIGQLVLEEPVDLLTATETPLVRSVGDQLVVRVRVTDRFDNPLPNEAVFLTLQQGLSVRSETQRTDAQGRATFTLSLPVASTYQFWLSVGGLRQPTDPTKTFRVQALPPLGELVAERVRGLGLPFFPPITPAGQPSPSLSDLLGVPASVLSGRVVRYDPVRQIFVPVNPANPIDQEGINAGVGLFVKPQETVTVRPQRGRLPDRDFVEVTLQRGWNLVSFPIAVPFPWALSNIQVRVGTSTRPLSSAMDTLLPLLWRWDPAARAYRVVFDRALAQGDFETTVQPWEAYFVYAFQPATLVVPVPVGARKATPSRGNSSLRLFTLRAQQGQEATILVLGLKDGGPALEVPVPPAPTDVPRIALLGADGTPVAVAVRPRQSRVLWSLVVQGKRDGEEVRVGGDNLASLPADWQMRLVDLTTGEQRFLRTGEWRAILKAGETRQLLLIAEPRSSLGLRVQQVKVTAMRGRGAVISFALTASAQTEVAIFSLTGRLIRVLDGRTYRQAGSHQIHWDGTDAQGHFVPQGAYLVRVRAHDDQGQIAQSGAVFWLR